MSAMDEFLAIYGDDADHINECKADLAALRAKAEQFDLIAARIDPNDVRDMPIASQVDELMNEVASFAQLRATVAEQARQLEAARYSFYFKTIKRFAQSVTNETQTGHNSAVAGAMTRLMVKLWEYNAANAPAPQAEQEQTK